MTGSDSYNNNLHKHATPKMYEHAKTLRQNTTKAEQVLWNELRNRKLSGLKFRRQHPVDKWIADFYCHEKKLIIELDGEVHNNKEANESDGGRSYELENLGLTVLRFWNEEVINHTDEVLKKIILAAEKL